ncbi:MAG: HAD-IA family hydrolase [Deltaproteobacteria bacterium]
MKVRCVIYDCDGVLFDSLEANERLYNDLCVSVGRPPLTREELTYVHCHTVFEAVHFMFKDDDGLEKKALELLKQVDFKQYIVFLKMEPHLIETLTMLKEKGILSVINTNRTTSMPHIMERFNLRPYFDMVVTALDVKNPKPHRESVDKIVDTLKLERNEVVFVGDSEVDRETAESAGVRFVAYKNRELGNNTLIDDHLDLLRLVLNNIQ